MENKAFRLLQLAKSKGIHISMDKGELQLKFSKGEIIKLKFLDELRENKKFIIDFLIGDRWKSKKVNTGTNIIKASNKNILARLLLSFSQERIWFIDQLMGSTHYHIPVVLRLKGSLDKKDIRVRFSNCSKPT